MNKVIIWLILCLIWGTTWIFIKVGLDDLPPIAFAASRFILGVAMVLAIIKVRKIPLPSTKAEWRSYRIDWIPAVLDQLQHGVLERAVYYVGTRRGIAGDDPRIWVGAGVDIPSSREDHGRQGFCRRPGDHRCRSYILRPAAGPGLMAFAGCVGVVAGSYAAAQASILIKAKGGMMHPASLLFGQMLCGLPAIIIYSLVVEGNPLTFHWSVKSDRLHNLLDSLWYHSRLLALLLAAEPHRIDKGDDDIARHATVSSCDRLGCRGRNTPSPNRYRRCPDHR